MTVGKRIKERRTELNMSADELAKRLNKNRATIYRYEKGEIGNLPIDILEPLAKALETTPQYLMGWEKENEVLTSSNGITMGDVFKSLRLGNKLTIEEFAKEIGISIEEIKSYETGEVQIPVNIINLVSDFFGISISELIGAHKNNTSKQFADIDIKKERFERFKVWNKEFGQVHFTEDEINKIMEYTRFLLSQRDK